MKEICETLFCFWKKCFKYTNKKISQIEYTKMLPQTHQKKKANTEFFSPKEKDKSTLKFKETDLITTKLAIIEEEIVFPNKYLNLFESEPNFKFEFTKKNIISFFESEINDMTEYKTLINKDGFDIYIKESGSVFSSEFPMIKMFYKIPKSKFIKKDVNVKLIDQYMNVPEKRLSWDSAIRDYKIIERDKEKEEIYIAHYICKSPIMFVSERDVVDKRYDFYENDIYYDFSSSVKDDFIPLEENIVRMTDHCSMYKMYEEKDEFNFVSITQMDTKYKLPNAMLSYQLPLNYKKWYDSLINAINEETAQNEQIEQIEKSENSEQDEQSSERLTSSEQN
jgi:hypothetical protein